VCDEMQEGKCKEVQYNRVREETPIRNDGFGEKIEI